jgi:hypothetical protein
MLIDICCSELDLFWRAQSANVQRNHRRHQKSPHFTENNLRIPGCSTANDYNSRVTADGEKLPAIGQLAERLQLSVETIRAKVRAGIIPAIRINAWVWRFHWETVLAALQKLQ